MAKTIYIENSIYEHPRTKKILNVIKARNIIKIDHYGEIFNRNRQNFRIQKDNLNYIIASKKNNLVIPTPPSTTSVKGYYFSHMYNCIYDCDYCFLQGHFNSAYHVYFINYEDFEEAIFNESIKTKTKTWFFSGYDCDSLASEKITGFAEYFVPLFSKLENSILELRTKSSRMTELLKLKPNPNVVCAFSLNPQNIIDIYEKGTPSLSSRISSIKSLSKKGWRIGFRFDPLILAASHKNEYLELFELAVNCIPRNSIHSVSLGSLRLSESHHKKMIKNDKRKQWLLDNRYSYKERLWQGDSKIRDTEIWLGNHLKRLIPQSSIFLSE